MDPRKLSIKDFAYSLPEDRIAKYPLPERDASKLLVYKEGAISENAYKHIDQLLPKNSLLIFNNTKVIAARILFRKSTGGVIEIFCLEPNETYPDITTAMTQRKSVLWQCMIGGASKWKHGQVLEKKINHHDHELILSAQYIEKKADTFTIQFMWNDDSLNFAELLNYAGSIPLPPYLKRTAEDSDAERYQTVYAQFEGSVAAPTAGLHFTSTVLKNLESSGIDTDYVTLHVGAGTFKPVKAEMMAQHEMHSEYLKISLKTIQHILENLSNCIVPVGTTSLRALESIYWIGAKIKAGKKNDFTINQWDPYDVAMRNLSVADSIEALIDYLYKENLQNLTIKTQLLISPPYRVKMAQALITNFHQPESTLLLLVAALIGDDWRKVYQYALDNNFRFLSYGDGCLLWMR